MVDAPRVPEYAWPKARHRSRFSMKISRNLRFQILLTLLILFSSYNVVTTINRFGVRAPAAVEEDEITVYGRRFECLQDSIWKYDVAGYTDVKGWFWAQYALAPTILAQGYDRPVVLGNFGPEESEQKTLAAQELELILDCGDGVRLYRGTVEP